MGERHVIVHLTSRTTKCSKMFQINFRSTSRCSWRTPPSMANVFIMIYIYDWLGRCDVLHAVLVGSLTLRHLTRVTRLQLAQADLVHSRVFVKRPQVSLEDVCVLSCQLTLNLSLLFLFKVGFHIQYLRPLRSYTCCPSCSQGASDSSGSRPGPWLDEYLGCSGGSLQSMSICRPDKVGVLDF